MIKLEFKRHSHKAVRMGVGFLALANLILLLSFFSPTIVTALPAGFQEYYILGNETQVFQMFQDIQTYEGSSIGAPYMASVITIVATADHQTIYYDHWEDGYEIDIMNPVQSTTEVYTGSLKAGDIITLNSDGGTGKHRYVPVAPRGTELRYDSSDRLASFGGPIDIVHSLWPRDTTVIGGAWEVYPIEAWSTGYSYIVPVGTDLYDGASGYFADFKYVWLEIQALDDNTTVHIDNHSKTVSVRLEQGQTYASLGYRDSTTGSIPSITVNSGTSVLSNKPIQVGLVAGGSGTFQTRFYTLVPDTAWGNEYVAPIPRTTTVNESEVFLYNPDDQDHIVTSYDTATPAGITFTLPAATSLAYRHPSAAGHYVPSFSAVRLHSDGPLWAIANADTASTDYDWGFAFVPTRYATQDYYVSWAPGTEDRTANGSPVWVTPLSNNTFFEVDYSNPTADGISDESFVMDALQTRRIFDPDNDNTGMHIWANKPFVTIWGEDPLTAGTGDNFLDLGYSVLPLHPEWLDPVLALQKSSDVQALPPNGGIVTFTLSAQAADYPVTNVNITDTLPVNWTYVSNSALVTYPSGLTAPREPLIQGRNLIWDLASSLDTNQSLEIRFQAQLTMTGRITGTVYDGFESNDYTGGSNWNGPWREYDPPECNPQCVSVVSNFPHNGNYHLAIQQTGAISRAADLSGFQQPTLRFWRQLRGLEVDDAFYIRLYDGSAWTTVLTLTSASGQNTYMAEQLDLDAYRSPNFALEIQSDSNPNDLLYLDDIEIFDDAAIHKNTAKVTGVYNNHLFSSQDETVIILTPLNLHKSVDKTAATGGDTLLYTFTYNNGSSALSMTNVVIRDVLPADTTFLEASPGATYSPDAHTVTWGQSPTITLLPGASGSLTVSVAVERQIDQAQVLRNVGYIDSDQTIEVSSNPVETVIKAPEISLVKSGPASAIPGQTITYTIQYANTGLATATGVIITDIIPLSTTYQADSLAIDTGSGYIALTDAPGDDAGQFDGNTISVHPGATIRGQIDPGEIGTIRFAVRISPTVSGGENIANYATLVRDYARPQNSALLLTAISDLTLEKVADRSIAGPGSTIAYTITLNNGGTVTQTEVYVRDSIPEHTSYLPGTVIVPPDFALSYSIDYGETWTTTLPTDPTSVTDLRWYTPIISDAVAFILGYRAQVEDPLSQGNVIIVNRAQVTSTQTALLYSDETYIRTVDLTVNKSASNATVTPGQHITYTITYGNNGSAAAPHTVITDRVPLSTTLAPGSISGGGVTNGRLITWIVDLPARASGPPLRFAVVVTSSMPKGVSVITNTAFISNELGSSATDTVTSSVITLPELQITKSAIHSIPLRPGDTITYNIVVSNNGHADATGAVIADDLTGGVSFVANSITLNPPGAGTTGTAPPVLVKDLTINTGQRVTVTFAAAISYPLMGDAIITNTASVTSTELPTPLTSTTTSTVTTTPVVNVTKYGPPAAAVGERVNFSFTVTNAGDTLLQNVIVRDDLAGTANYVTGDNGDGWLDLNEAWVFTAAYTIPLTAVEALTNTATVTATDTIGAKVITDSDLHVTTISHTWALNIVKDGPAVAVVGETVVFTFTVTNAGDGLLQNVVVKDDVAGTANYVTGDNGDGRLDLSEAWVFTATYTIPLTTANALTNTATVTATDTTGAIVIVDSDSHVTTIFPISALNIVKDGPAVAVVGETVVFTFMVTNDDVNSSGAPVNTISVSDSVAGPAHLASVSNDDGDSLLEVGETWIYTADYTIQLTDPDLLVNTGVVQGKDENGLPVSATDVHSTTTVGWPILSLSKKASADPVAPGETFTYSLYITNSGRAAHSLVAGDVLPTDVAFVRCGGAICSLSDGAVVWGPLDMAGAGTTLALTLTVRADPSLSNGRVITNADYWLVAQDVPLLNGPPVTTTVNLAQLSFENKFVGKSGDEVFAGSRLEYFLVVSNTGGYATHLVVSDTLPAYTSFGGCNCAVANLANVTPFSTQESGFCGAPFTCNLEGDQVVWHVDRMDGGSSLQMTFWVTVDADAPENTLIVNDSYAVVADHLSPVVGNLPVTMIVRQLLVSISKTAWPNPVNVGQQLSFTITVRNDGGPHSNVTVTDVLPYGVSFITCEPNDGQTRLCQGEGRKVMWWLSTLDAQTEQEFSVRVSVDAIPSGVIVNQFYSIWVPAAEQLVTGIPVEVVVINPFTKRLYLPLLLSDYP